MGRELPVAHPSNNMWEQAQVCHIKMYTVCYIRDHRVPRNTAKDIHCTLDPYCKAGRLGDKQPLILPNLPKGNKYASFDPHFVQVPRILHTRF
ncbi:hypothetical protein Zmor_005241 [Zophobas morio]|uniref:Uncharacterized protein n=1 Tax=Zophobas morio TaxID=2755281 RepID=A0AA38IPK5_9CUCU|nr:hypothetical protein Zmor_005241 [Zophobas morio]